MKALPLVVVLVASPLLAGCLGFGDDPAPSVNKTSKNGSDLPLVVPDNRGGGFAAFNETNLTDNLGHHNHDYWQGRSRVPIFAGHAELDFGGEAIFRPPSGPEHLIFEGTGLIEILIKNPARHACEPFINWGGALICTDHTQTGLAATGEIKGPPVPDPSPPTNLQLSFLHAAAGAEEWIDAGTLTWATPSLIKITDAKWTDMPHSSGSLWVFRIRSPDAQDAGTLTFDIEATAVRTTGEVPLWPGHPVFYTDAKHYRVVYDGPGKTTSGGNLGPTSAEFAEPGKLISAGTKTLIVSANVTSINGQVPNTPPSHVYFYYHNASYTNWNFTDPFDANYTADKGSYLWIIRVDPNGMDSPYAANSRWEFMLRAAFSTPLVTCYDGCYGYDMEYRLTIVASDLEPACLAEEGGKCVSWAYSQSRRA